MAEKRKRKPRVAPVEAATPAAVSTDGRIPSGIVGLDEVLEGGLRQHTATVVVGASGTGKSTFAMQYLLTGLFSMGAGALTLSPSWRPQQLRAEANYVHACITRSFWLRH